MFVHEGAHNNMTAYPQCLLKYVLKRVLSSLLAGQTELTGLPSGIDRVRLLKYLLSLFRQSAALP